MSEFALRSFKKSVVGLNDEMRRTKFRFVFRRRSVGWEIWLFREDKKLGRVGWFSEESLTDAVRLFKSLKVMAETLCLAMVA